MEKEEQINIQNLLNQVNLISKHYDRISSLTGEKFNIFSIMSMEKNEVYTHSAIITELLNPYGNHGQTDVFLKEFITIINSKIERDKDGNNKISYLNNCEGLKEHTIKESSEIKPCSGRIDIYITNKKQSIIIENKIDAESQPDQLLRYYNYAINKYRNEFWLIYLQKTESNHTPNDLKYSCGFTDNFSNINSNATKNKVIKITYEKEILQWLKECLKHTSNLPIIRETINQYIHLVNKITNQSNNNLMEHDILDLITSTKENVRNAIQIRNTTKKIEDILCNIFIKKLKTEAEKLGLMFKSSEYLTPVDSFFMFYKEEWKYAISFEFLGDDLSKLVVGIALKENGEKHDSTSEFNKNIRKILNYKDENNDVWSGWNDFNVLNDIPWEDFITETPVKLIMDEVKDIYKKVGFILDQNLQNQ